VPPPELQRRIVAAVLPELLNELANGFSSGEPSHAPRRHAEFRRGPRVRRKTGTSSEVPAGILLVDEGSNEKPAPAATAVLAAVNDAAKRFGVRAGHTVAEANAILAHLVVREVRSSDVAKRLGEIAEVTMAFGPTVSFEAPDTVWVDVTGAQHLAGGEEALALELGARIRALGHVVRVAVSNGPKLAQAFARWGRTNREGSLVVPSLETPLRIGQLPVRALPIDAELSSWLVRLGVHTIGDLARLPRSASASRLGSDPDKILDLAEGRDASPLVAYVPPSMPTEETSFEAPVDGVQALLFVLRGLVSRLGARLEGRGEAVQALDLVLQHDKSIARLKNVPNVTALHFELASPLWRPEEFFRVIASRLNRVRLGAPTVGISLEAHAVTRALALQLDLSRYAAGLGGGSAKGPETLPVVLAELTADLGKDMVGILRLEGSHKPEAKSRLVPVSPEVLTRGAVKVRPKKALDEALSASLAHAPTRLLARPIAIDSPLRPGATLCLDHRLYSIERVTFENRLEAVEWWTETPAVRDYVRLWLRGPSGGMEALVYVDRTSGVRMLQGICD
jgi:protein ImuB